MKILQLIPAPGWFATYKVEEETYWSPLACWALVEDSDGSRHVDGIDMSGDGADGSPSSELSNFLSFELGPPPPSTPEAVADR